MVIVLADVANLASTALTIAIQRDWIVVITGYNRGHLAGEEICYLCLALHPKSWNCIQNLLFTHFYSFCKSSYESTLTSLFFCCFFFSKFKQKE